MSVTAYCMADAYDQAPATAITFGIQDLEQSDLRCDDRWVDALQNGKLTLSRGSGGNRQQFEQHFENQTSSNTELSWSQ